MRHGIWRLMGMSRRKKKIQQPENDNRPIFKIALDYKTIITVRSKEAIERWLDKFPNARVIAE